MGNNFIANMSISTPYTDHLDFENVYEPAEDSFLLLDALESELDVIQTCIKPVMCVEIGSGSGIISTGLCSALGTSCFFMCCDINADACKATNATKIKNNVADQIDVVECDMLQCLALESKVDLLLCNPPYVATSDGEYDRSLGLKDVKAAWAGGCEGRRLTDVLIANLPRLLTPNGAAYIVLEQCNKPNDVALFAEECGLSQKIIAERRAGRELLYVMKLYLAKKS